MRVLMKTLLIDKYVIIAMVPVILKTTKLRCVKRVRKAIENSSSDHLPNNQENQF